MARAEELSARPELVDQVDGERLVIGRDGPLQVPQPAHDLGADHELSERAGHARGEVAEVVHQVGTGQRLDGERERRVGGRLPVDQLGVTGSCQGERRQTVVARHGDAGGALVGSRVAVDHRAHVETAAAQPFTMNGAPSRVSCVRTRPSRMPAVISATLPARVAGVLTPAWAPGTYRNGRPRSASSVSFSSASRLGSSDVAALT